MPRYSICIDKAPPGLHARDDAGGNNGSHETGVYLVSIDTIYLYMFLFK